MKPADADEKFPPSKATTTTDTARFENNQSTNQIYNAKTWSGQFIVFDVGFGNKKNDSFPSDGRKASFGGGGSENIDDRV